MKNPKWFETMSKAIKEQIGDAEVVLWNRDKCYAVVKVVEDGVNVRTLWVDRCSLKIVLDDK